MKTCSKCKIEKSFDHFSKSVAYDFQAWCIQCTNEYGKIWRENNREKLLLRRKENKEKKRKYDEEYRKGNPEKIKERSKRYYQENKEILLLKSRKRQQENIEQTREYKRRWKKRKRKEDVSFKLRENVSGIIRFYLNNQNGIKDSSTWSKLPYTPQELKEHLESQFETWMTWENYGAANTEKRTWNIDHIVPQSKFLYDSLDHPNFQKCWSLNNLRPLCARENSSKGDKLCE